MNGPTRVVRPTSPSPLTTVWPGSTPSRLPASTVTVRDPGAVPAATTCAGTTSHVPAVAEREQLVERVGPPPVALAAGQLGAQLRDLLAQPGDLAVVVAQASPKRSPTEPTARCAGPSTPSAARRTALVGPPTSSTTRVAPSGRRAPAAGAARARG